jgi:deazaflavin-dependent oxidoreductase (nitroreductase family)
MDTLPIPSPPAISAAARTSGPPEPLEGVTAAIVPAVNKALRTLNRWFMVPSLRLGLGAWLGTPFGGYILMLRVRGRKSGLIRETPLSYYVAEGCAWVMAGFGDRTEWFRNLQVDPVVEVWLPGRVLPCRAEEVADPEVRARILPALTRAAGVPGTMIGCNPWSAPDERILEALSAIPLVRLAPVSGPIAAGPDDPGGLAWTWRQGLVLVITIWLLRAGWGRRPRGRAARP